MNPQEVILHPIMTESTTRQIEEENRLVFIVNIKANKVDVKKAVEELYEVKVSKVNTLITPRGRKKAFVKLEPDYKAADVAIKLGIL
ncbi:MAG: 50S ribosomal protein L23 [Candidatus Bathyarchaeota archaeon]|nr:50S ribosomal protein L23 [Candidatus Bathyarchaeota archaeon]